MCRQVRRQVQLGLARRAREKVHRPQTRRRRENNEDSLDKMQAMRKNIRKAVEIMEHLVRREHKKLHIAVSPLPFNRTNFRASHRAPPQTIMLCLAPAASEISRMCELCSSSDATLACSMWRRIFKSCR